MELIVIGDKYSLDIRQTVDQVQTFFQPQGETGSAQSVAVYGFIGDDGDRNQIVVIGISCGRIQDMVIKDAVLLKVPLVNAGRHYRLIRDLHNSFCFAPVCEGLLDTNAEGRSIRTLTHTEDIAAQIDDPSSRR